MVVAAAFVGCFSTSLVHEAGRPESGRPEATIEKSVGQSGEASAADSAGDPRASNREPATKPAFKQTNQPHNGGKIRIPIDTSFVSLTGGPGETVISVPVAVDRTVRVTAEEELLDASISIDGTGGLSGLVLAPQKYAKLAAGDRQEFTFTIPAQTGSLIVRVAGTVNGLAMSGAFELKAINPKQVNISSKPGEQDSLGTVIQSVPAGKVDAR